jgi:hypothetical protein
MTEHTELLLILEPPSVSSHLAERYRITQKASPRVVIVEADAVSSKDELQKIEGVKAVLAPGEGPPPELRHTLSAGELIFVDAYSQRGVAKTRPGDGLAWDTEGFLPP